MAAATVTSDLYNTASIAPLTAQGEKWYDYYIADQADTNESGDIIKLLKLPKDVSVEDAYLRLGDFDTHATPTVTHSLTLHDGTTEYEIIKDFDGGQDGVGMGRCSDTDEVKDALGKIITAAMVTAGAYIGLKATAATATAATSGRTVNFGVRIRNRAQDRS